jgi:hypothetical protein
LNLRHLAFDDVLDRSLEALRQGQTLDAVLATYPRYTGDLRPLLESAIDAGLLAPPPVPTARLERNYTVVRAALQRARFAERAAPPAPLPAAPWWRRPVAFASMSVPAGAFVLAVLGASGAAAATFATTPLNLSDVLPDEVAHVLTIDTGDGPASATNGVGQGVVPGDKTPPAGATNAPGFTTITGSVSDIDGNTFTLTAGDGEWKVNVSGQTLVDGVIAEGATAEVTGDVTAEKNMHADSVDVLTDGTPESTKPWNSDGTPGRDPDKTTGPDADKTKGPDKTPAPDKTPPGHGGEPPGQEQGAGPPGHSDENNGNDGGRKKP